LPAFLGLQEKRPTVVKTEIAINNKLNFFKSLYFNIKNKYKSLRFFLKNYKKKLIRKFQFIQVTDKYKSKKLFDNFLLIKFYNYAKKDKFLTRNLSFYNIIDKNRRINNLFFCLNKNNQSFFLTTLKYKIFYVKRIDLNFNKGYNSLFINNYNVNNDFFIDNNYKYYLEHKIKNVLDYKYMKLIKLNNNKFYFYFYIYNILQYFQN